jgi:hypothetical protein
MEADLNNEIRILSNLILRLERISNDCEERGELMKLINQVGKAATRKANLIKVQKGLQPENDEIDDMLLRALKQATKEMGLNP